MTTSIQTETPAKPVRRGIKWLVWLLVIVSVFAAIRYFHAEDKLRVALGWMKHSGAWGPVCFILLYILACVFSIPGSVLSLGAGAVFGVVQGSIYVSTGATLGATAAFLVGRHLARDWVARRIAGNRTFEAIDKAVAREGWKIVGLTRLSPVFPFNLLNYAFGVTRVSLRDYFLASWIGMMPGTVMYVYIGSLVNESAAHMSRAQTALKITGLVATVAVTVLLTRIARKALVGKTANAACALNLDQAPPPP